MMIEINYHAETLETAICEAIVTYLGYGMPAREIIDQLISRGFIRDPGNNAREVVVQRLADVAERMRRGIPSLDPLRLHRAIRRRCAINSGVARRTFR